MRAVLVMAVAVMVSGCTGLLAPKASLDAIDAAKVRESIAVKFTLHNEQSVRALDVHFAQFHLRSGTGLFTCTNQASGWRLLHLDASRRLVEDVKLEPKETLQGYLLFGLCPDVAGPYKLSWNGDGRGMSADDNALVRTLDTDANATGGDFDLITVLARDWHEEHALLR